MDIALKTYSTCFDPDPIGPIIFVRDPAPSCPTPLLEAAPTGAKPLLSLRARSDEDRLCRSDGSLEEDDSDDDKLGDDEDSDDSVVRVAMSDLGRRSKSGGDNDLIYPR